MSIDVFGNSPAMTRDEMFAAGLITDLTDEAELTPRGQALVDGDPVTEIDLDSEILTVGRLRQILDGRPDAEQVVMDDGDGWYVNVRGIGLPSADPDRHHSDWSALTLFAGEGIDPRQF
jgi:hypothetical protein